MNPKAFEQICIVSRGNVCLLDMNQVREAAESMNLRTLADLIAADLDSNQIVDGQYYKLIAPMFGVTT
jgi:hypothetical protein